MDFILQIPVMGTYAALQLNSVLDLGWTAQGEVLPKQFFLEILVYIIIFKRASLF